MSTALEDPFGLLGTTLDGRFAIDRVVARGGFGIVYQGRQLRLRKTIAFKVLFIPPKLDSESRQAFLEGFVQEAQTIAQLDHPAIVRVFDFGISLAPNGKEMPWMALEWIEGRTLADYFEERRRRPLSPAEALTILRPVFHALAFAHAQRVAHRDIKPSNIMLVGSGGGSMAGTVSTRLLDFGIAKVMNPDEGQTSGETRTHAAFSAFSLPYAAPEQKVGLKTGPWTDVHALGLILTELLCGQSPYPGVDRLEVEMRLMSPLRPTPAMFQVDVGVWEPLIARAVSFRAPERFQDAGAFLAALEASVPVARSVAFNVPSTTEPMHLAHANGSPPIAPMPAPARSFVEPSTITDSPTISGVQPQRARSPNRRVLAVIAGLTAILVGAVGTVAVTTFASRPTPAPSASPAPSPVPPAASPTATAPANIAARSPLPEVRPRLPPSPATPDASVGPAAPPRPLPLAATPEPRAPTGRPRRPQTTPGTIDFRAQQGVM